MNIIVKWPLQILVGHGDKGSTLPPTGTDRQRAESLEAQEPSHGLLHNPGHFTAFHAAVILQGGIRRRGEVDRAPSPLACLPSHETIPRGSSKRCQTL